MTDLEKERSVGTTPPGTGPRRAVGQTGRSKAMVLETAQSADFTHFYEENLGRLIAHVMKLGSPYEEAADIVQEAFIAALPQWDAIAHKRAWLRTVCMRIHVRYRRRGRQQISSDEVDSLDSDRSVEQVEFRDMERRVREAIARLPRAQREVMAWDPEEFTVAEIAAALGCTVASVKTNRSRARARLKAELGLKERDRDGD
ncbi:RNA polymerase sigma factor [Streptomyces sp. NBC_00557]|uniref:RNA polymerase sigma factor n=1 Tax=Streptomyces sp. NBC_00557 TaxID=2975776 RepID=UPI002E82113B|nr:sigma-70 family RNA polymerase sigma factor [Streptomyces sp. NBC_00557]WUC39581.1 sigma-70 family RNA polymerase sigma factor [Streptomyces sp. NBC_00557]